MSWLATRTVTALFSVFGMCDWIAADTAASTTTIHPATRSACCARSWYVAWCVTRITSPLPHANSVEGARPSRGCWAAACVGCKTCRRQPQGEAHPINAGGGVDACEVTYNTGRCYRAQGRPSAELRDTAFANNARYFPTAPQPHARTGSRAAFCQVGHVQLILMGQNCTCYVARCQCSC